MLPLIFIPSKGRPDGSTMRLLKEQDVGYICVIEEEDREAYQMHPVAVLPESNRGIGYSRNWIATQCRVPFIRLDDDLKTFYRKTETGTQSITLKELLIELSEFGRTHDYSVVGCQRSFFGISSKPYVENREIAILLYVKGPIDYDESKRCFEDIDMVIRQILNKRKVAKMSNLVYFTTLSGCGKKGTGVDYSNELKRKEALRMKEQYPAFFEILEGETYHKQPRFKVNWSKLNKYVNSSC